MKKISLIITTFFISLICVAQWNTDPSANTAICSTPPVQVARTGTVVTPDGFGAMFIAWIDSRSSGVTGDSIYIQKVDLANSQYFDEDGKFVVSSSTAISNLTISPDGVGGVLLAWQSNNDIFGMRVAANGMNVWPAPVALSKTTIANQTVPIIAIVSFTEAMVAFNDNRNGNTDLYLNKIDISTGNLLLPIDTPICKATGTQNQHNVFPDQNGGLYISWSDGRATGNIDLYALRVKNDGLPETGWTTDGTVICNATGSQSNSLIITDNAGGVYVVWEDFRSGNTDVYAQRISGAGSISWAANGALVCNAANNQQLPQLVPRSDGVIITWTDAREGTSNRNIYAQKLAAADGAAAWVANGVVVCDAADQQPSGTTAGLKIVPDATNGAIIVWNDQRNGNTNRNIYAQRINTSGAVQWATNGISISNATGNQGPDLGVLPITITNGAYIVWQDSRSPVVNGEIYGAVVDGSGNLVASVTNRLAIEGKIKAYPVPASKEIYLSLSKVKPGAYTVQVMDVSGRMLLQSKTEINGSEGLIETRIEKLQSGVYFIKLVHENTKAESVFRFVKQ